VAEVSFALGLIRMDDFWKKLDEVNDEAEVRRRIAEGLYNQRHLGIENVPGYDAALCSLD
jgi:hypothetical protein